MSAELIVNEIFDSIDGEGKTAGELATFIRLTGCNLRCAYCDTVYAFGEGAPMTVPDIVSRVRFRHVTLTGGEPLLQPINPLLRALPPGTTTNVETNGSIALRPFMDDLRGFFTIDYKCGSSGENGKMLRENFLALRPCDVLKFVVGSAEDLREARDFSLAVNTPAQIFVSPVFGQIEPAAIVDFMKAHALQNWRLQLQMHKYIWRPDARGV